MRFAAGDNRAVWNWPEGRILGKGEWKCFTDRQAAWLPSLD